MTWQVKDFGDGWFEVADEAAAQKLSEEQSGAAVRPNPSPSDDDILRATVPADLLDAETVRLNDVWAVRMEGSASIYPTVRGTEHGAQKLADRLNARSSESPRYEPVALSFETFRALHDAYPGDTRLIGLAPDVRIAAASNGLRSGRDALFEALTEVMAWIDVWTPNFCLDDDWPATNAKANEAIDLAKQAHGSVPISPHQPEMPQSDG